MPRKREPLSREDLFLRDVRMELARARDKFPGANVNMLALVEEVGELARASFSESRERVYREALQVATMALRMAVEGDATLADWREQQSLDPLAGDGNGSIR